MRAEIDILRDIANAAKSLRDAPSRNLAIKLSTILNERVNEWEKSYQIPNFKPGRGPEQTF